MYCSVLFNGRQPSPERWQANTVGKPRSGSEGPSISQSHHLPSQPLSSSLHPRPSNRISGATVTPATANDSADCSGVDLRGTASGSIQQGTDSPSASITQLPAVALAHGFESTLSSHVGSLKEQLGGLGLAARHWATCPHPSCKPERCVWLLDGNAKIAMHCCAHEGCCRAPASRKSTKNVMCREHEEEREVAAGGCHARHAGMSYGTHHALRLCMRTHCFLAL